MVNTLTGSTTYFQAILASAFAKKDYNKVTATASRVLQVAKISQQIISLVFLGKIPPRLLIMILCCSWVWF